jgi:hypothetical protein
MNGCFFDFWISWNCVRSRIKNNAVPEAGAPMSPRSGFWNDAVPEAGAPMGFDATFVGNGACHKTESGF